MKRDSKNFQSGMVAPFFAISMVTLLIFAAFAIDGGMAHVNQRRIHIAADAASLAGASLFSPTVLDNDIYSEARRVAALNGVSNSEISSIQCGKWDTISGVSSFRACCGSLQTCPCVNCRDATADSVRVITRRTVPTTFARIMNLNSLSPSGLSVAKAVRSSTCVKPIGVEAATLSGVSVGSTFTLSKNSPGNWGKLNLGGVNMASGQNFEDAMLTNSCPAYTVVTPGQPVPVGTGFGGSIKDVMEEVLASNLNQGIYLILNSPFPNGSGSVTVNEILKVDFLGATGQGANWVGSFRLVERNASPGANGSTVDRDLVQ